MALRDANPHRLRVVTAGEAGADALEAAGRMSMGDRLARYGLAFPVAFLAYGLGWLAGIARESFLNGRTVGQAQYPECP